jgi:hypothetical protein
MDPKALDQMAETLKPTYYEDLGRGHDCILRCKDCQHLVTYPTITKLGMCHNCGNKRFSQVIILKQEEMDAIRNGQIQFEDSDKFLAEFTGIEV